MRYRSNWAILLWYYIFISPISWDYRPICFMVASSRNFSLYRICFSMAYISIRACSYFLSSSSPSYPSPSSTSSSSSIISCDDAGTGTGTTSLFPSPYTIFLSLAFSRVTLCNNTFFCIRIFSSLALSASKALYSAYRCRHMFRL